MRPWRQREQELRRLGHEIDLVTAAAWNEGGRTVSTERAGEEYVHVTRTVGSHPFTFLYNPGPIIRVMRRQRYGVLDAHEEPASLAAAELLLLRALFARTSKVVLYSAENLYKRYPLPFRLLERWALRAASGIYVCNSDARDILRRKGFTGVIDVIPLGVDIDAFSPVAWRDIDDSSMSVGYVGRLTDRKGVHVLLDAVTDLPWCHVDYVGQGPEYERLAQAIHDRGLGDRVRLLGHATAEELPAIYRTFDVLAVPSQPTTRWTEQFCRVAVEAMASGLPLVVSRSGALPEVAGAAALYVPPGDPAALADALQTLHTNPEVRQRLRAASTAQAPAYSWAAVARGHAALYQAIVAGGPDGTAVGQNV
jgi:glycosyltransferase involved in cell wall biosynthesis